MKDDVKRLYRSKQDKIIAGVCGGIAEYLKIDPVWVRLIAVLLIFAHGIGLLLYIVAWILIPLNPNQPDKVGEQKKDIKSGKEDSKVVKEEKKALKEEKMTNEPEKHSGRHGSSIVGYTLVFLGAAFLFQNVFDWFSFNYVWPIAIIGIGLVILARRRENEK